VRPPPLDPLMRIFTHLFVITNVTIRFVYTIAKQMSPYWKLIMKKRKKFYLQTFKIHVRSGFRTSDLPHRNQTRYILSHRDSHRVMLYMYIRFLHVIIHNHPDEIRKGRCRGVKPNKNDFARKRLIIHLLMYTY